MEKEVKDDEPNKALQKDAGQQANSPSDFYDVGEEWHALDDADMKFMNTSDEIDVPGWNDDEEAFYDSDQDARALDGSTVGGEDAEDLSPFETDYEDIPLFKDSKTGAGYGKTESQEETDPSYDQKLDMDYGRLQDENWNEDIPDELDIRFEGEEHHHAAPEGTSGPEDGDKKRKKGKNKRQTDGRVSRSAHGSSKESSYVDRHGKTHRHAPASSSERHRHHRVHGWKKALLILGTVLCTLALVVLISWRVLDALGRGRLYQKGNEGPVIAELSVDESEVQETTTGSGWQSDWIRYNGKVYDYNENILTFLIMGIDLESEEDTIDALHGGQADALFLLILNPDEKTISILAINRATMIEIDVYDEEDNFLYTGIGQICLQHGYGDGKEESCERQTEVVKELLYNLPIHGYAAINMSAIPTINNSIGGVTLEALEDIKCSGIDYSWLTHDASDTTRDLVAGETYTLSGLEAYRYTRFRDTSVTDSASLRLKRQKQYITQFVKDMKSALSRDITVALDLYNAISADMVTNVDLAEITYLAGIIGGYSLDDEIYELFGETIVGEESESGFDEFYVDDDSLYELMIELFYSEVEGFESEETTETEEAVETTALEAQEATQ